MEHRVQGGPVCFGPGGIPGPSSLHENLESCIYSHLFRGQPEVWVPGSEGPVSGSMSPEGLRSGSVSLVSLRVKRSDGSGVSWA